MGRKTRRVKDDELRQLLVDRGLRVTEQRMTLLRELARLRVPASHPDLTDRLAQRAARKSGLEHRAEVADPSRHRYRVAQRAPRKSTLEHRANSTLDRATIYRNLVVLTDAGLLVRTQLGDNVWRYELPNTNSTEHGAHPHFVCTDCGDVACLPESTVTLCGEAIRNEVAEVQLRGRCVSCATH